MGCESHEDQIKVLEAQIRELEHINSKIGSSLPVAEPTLQEKVSLA